MRLFSVQQVTWLDAEPARRDVGRYPNSFIQRWGGTAEVKNAETPYAHAGTRIQQ